MAAPMKSRNSGCGLVGRLLNSGWNWQATNQGWSGSSIDLHQPLVGRGAADDQPAFDQLLADRRC